MNADYFVTSHVFGVFGIVMIVGAAMMIAALTIRDRIQRSRKI
jgi:hypothetical protein